MDLERYIDYETPWLGNKRWVFPAKGTLDELVALLLMLGCNKVEDEHSPGKYSVYPPGINNYNERIGKKLVFFEPDRSPDPSVNIANLTEFLEELEENDEP